MNEYVVGSVADLISNKKLPKKRKFELDNKSKVTVSNNDSKNVKVTTVFPSANSKNKSSSLPEKGVPNKKQKNLSKIKNSVENTEKTETASKKRKKLSEEFIPSISYNEEESYDKHNIDLLSLDHIPSDSEEEEEEKEKEGQSLEKKINKKKSSTSSKETSFRNNKENTIFVGNIPINFDKHKVCKVFSKFGKIQSARIRCVPVENINMSKKVAAIKKKFNPKRNSLVAYVKYESQDSVYAALKANGMVIDGHHLRVDLAEQVKERDNNKAVFVGGLPFDIEDDELWEFFQNCGEISSVRVIRDSQTSIGKGFGYVNFTSAASVELALQLDGQELKKRTINVKRCVNSRNKNKLNSFGKKKSKEITTQLLSKKGKKYKEEKKKLKKENKKFLGDFQGKTANMKQKKKKKLSKVALRQRKLVKILGAS